MVIMFESQLLVPVEPHLMQLLHKYLDYYFQTLPPFSSYLDLI